MSAERHKLIEGSFGPYKSPNWQRNESDSIDKGTFSSAGTPLRGRDDARKGLEYSPNARELFMGKKRIANMKGNAIDLSSERSSRPSQTKDEGLRVEIPVGLPPRKRALYKTISHQHKDSQFSHYFCKEKELRSSKDDSSQDELNILTGRNEPLSLSSKLTVESNNAKIQTVFGNQSVHSFKLKGFEADVIYSDENLTIEFIVFKSNTNRSNIIMKKSDTVLKQYQILFSSIERIAYSDEIPKVLLIVLKEKAIVGSNSFGSIAYIFDNTVKETEFITVLFALGNSSNENSFLLPRYVLLL